MTNKEFNKKYDLSDTLVEGSLKKYIPQSDQNFNNVAGKPKKMAIEIFKRFATNWVIMLCFILFVVILLISIIVTSSARYSATKPVSTTVEIFLLNGSKYTGGSSSFDKNLPPQYSSFVSIPLITDPVTYKTNVEQWIDPQFYGGYIGNTVLGGKGIGWDINAQTKQTLVNAYRFYDANTMAVLLTNSGIDPKTTSAAQAAEYVSQLRKLNPQISLKTFLGTNSAGVDIWTSSWVGTWQAIRLAIIVATLQTIIGVAVGSYLGFHVGKWLDTVMMRIIDIFMAPPTLIWLLLFATLFGTSDLTLGTALVFVGWTNSVGATRMFIITVKDEEYILASQSIGASKPALIYKHALPAIIGKIATNYVHSIPSIIMSVSSLAFLGFFKSEDANLGTLLSNATAEAVNNVWILLLPSLILLSISVSLHFVALGVHDALDPKVIRIK
ncbi:ABC transporter permease [Mycoplasma crocodyli]|uniref:Oligopeptide ABC transporter, permease protein OppC n=1 Tax=Mycoplasma crocodyli (strain ATCC 51981 / MP145) TaxID=512564 RepID=D5E634_MYCCM|nr:ABC transporter permease [Mycoplasma crocodyli]ADE19623.1 oligopeptide ABC transporter, permease protein OppC [Mycoplasma crocodyli MP145]